MVLYLLVYRRYRKICRYCSSTAFFVFRGEGLVVLVVAAGDDDVVYFQHHAAELGGEEELLALGDEGVYDEVVAHVSERCQ